MGMQGRFFILSALVALGAGCTGNLDATPSDPSGQTAVAVSSRRDERANHHARRWPRDDAGTPADDAGSATTSDAGSPTTTSDAGSPTTTSDAGSPTTTSDAGAPPPPADSGTPTGACVAARRLWFDDFETGDYSRWTSNTYNADWGDGCEDNALSTVHPHSGTYSNRSEITCDSGASVHRGYGGVQFSGDTPLSAYTNTGVGTDAPDGLVNTFWVWLETPYDFGGGRWLSLWTTNSDCGWAEQVVTLGLENASRVLTPAHVASTGGTVTFTPGAPALPLGRWVRITVYVNYHRGEMHVWQDGASVVHGTFSRPSTDVCQWHWGAYASGDNTDIVLFEDDKSIWKLGEPWTDWSREPWFDGDVAACP